MLPLQHQFVGDGHRFSRAASANFNEFVIPGREPCAKIDASINFGAGRASPESITTAGSMDSGPAPSGASTMCNCTSGNDEVKSINVEHLIDRPNQVLDFLGVRPELLGELVEIGIGDRGEAGFVDVGHDLHADRFQLLLRLMLKLD